MQWRLATETFNLQKNMGLKELTGKRHPMAALHVIVDFLGARWWTLLGGLRPRNMFGLSLRDFLVVCPPSETTPHSRVTS